VHAVQLPATLCNRLERHAAAFILNMPKTNAQRVRQHVVGMVWQHGGVFESAVGALWARCVYAVII